MPDYEIIHWNANNFKISEYKWVEQAVNHKKWAFATDFIRFWAVYNNGGIYLDADVEVLKSFDAFLHLPYFLGIEQNFEWQDLPEMSTFGAEPKAAWIKDCLDYYENRNFVNKNGELDITTLPEICRNILKKKYGILKISSIESFDKGKKEMQLFTSDFFSPKSFITDELIITQNTHSIHHFSSSWMSANERRKIQITAKYKNKFTKHWKILLCIVHPIISLELFLEGRKRKRKVKK
jgi:hypothetical protein